MRFINKISIWLILLVLVATAFLSALFYMQMDNNLENSSQKIRDSLIVSKTKTLYEIVHISHGIIENIDNADDAISALSDIKFKDQTAYLSIVKETPEGFVYVLHSVEKQLKGQAYDTNIKDLSGQRFRKRLLAGADQNVHGMFLQTSNPRGDSQNIENRLHFMLKVPKFNWYIGSSIGLQEVETAVSMIRESFYRNFLDTVSLLYIAVIPLVFLIYRLAKLFFKRSTAGLVSCAKLADETSIRLMDGAKEFSEVSNYLGNSFSVLEKTLKDSYQVIHNFEVTYSDNAEIMSQIKRIKENMDLTRESFDQNLLNNEQIAENSKRLMELTQGVRARVIELKNFVKMQNS